MATTGIDASAKSVAARAARSRSAAGAMNGVWKAPPTGSGSTLRAPRSLASAVASAMASGSPAITTWPAPLLLATHTSPVAASHAAATASSSAPSTAAIVPGRASAAACMAAPRSVTRRTPSSSAQRADRGEGAVLAEAVAGGAGAAHAEAGDGVVHDEAEDVGGELRVLGALELLGVGVEEQGGDVAAAGLGGGGDDGPGRVVGPGAAHPGLLGPLAGEREGEHQGSDRAPMRVVSHSGQVPPG